MKTRIAFASLLAALFVYSPASARDPIIIIENGVRTPFNQQGLLDFAKDYETNPRDLTLEILGHPFGFDVSGPPGPPCTTNCTSLRFTSDELGLDETFAGANTAEVSAAFKDFIKSQDFLKRFMRLINAGAGAQISGSPVGSIGSAVRMGFQDVMFSSIKTAEEKGAPPPKGQDPAFSGGFAQFSSDGFNGRVLSVTPGFGLDFGAKRDKHLKFSFPLTQIDVEGLKTYRAGLALQYLYPVYFGDGYTLTLGPGASYLTTFSLDLPNYSGLLGGALSTALQKDWEKTFATGAVYYGRFNNLGGFDTDIQANIYGWGAQAGYRFAKRWVAAVHLVGLHERVTGFPVTTYHTISASCSYKILNRFNLQLSASKLVGLPKQRFADVGLGTIWFF